MSLTSVTVAVNNVTAVLDTKLHCLFDFLLKIPHSPSKADVGREQTANTFPP